MKFVHDAPDFADLLRIVGAERTPVIAAPLVEKDYWVTHTLWSVQRSGLECWFKGGTSLSKGFGLIQRFSEDLDLKLGPGTVKDLAAVENWHSEGKQHIARRHAFFEGVARTLRVPKAKVELRQVDATWRSAELAVHYASVIADSMPAPMRPFVVVEAGSARVVPHVARDLSSFVHDGLVRRGLLADFTDNRPRAVNCVHPAVTLIEKLDAISRRFERETTMAASFVRHYEDAGSIIAALGELSAVPGGIPALLAEMVEHRDIRSLPSPNDPSLTPSDSPRWIEVRAAHAATGVLYFGQTIGIEGACERIRGWLDSVAGLA